MLVILQLRFFLSAGHVTASFSTIFYYHKQKMNHLHSFAIFRSDLALASNVMAKTQSGKGFMANAEMRLSVVLEKRGSVRSPKKRLAFCRKECGCKLSGMEAEETVTIFHSRHWGFENSVSFPWFQRTFRLLWNIFIELHHYAPTVVLQKGKMPYQFGLG